MVDATHVAAPVSAGSWPRSQDRDLEPPDETPSPLSSRGSVVRALPLLTVLAFQAVLSVRLVWSNTAATDEALYLWVGHLEWSHWLYGAQIPPFATYLSGAPVVYPPLGALADTYGGLAAARLLSLGFMLGATFLLHSLTRRVFGWWPALLAAALFAGVGSAQFLGAFATYNAMALFLLALAAWLGVWGSERAAGARYAAWVLSGAALVLANATAYASSLLDPVVIVATAALGWRRGGRWQGVAALAVVSLTVLGFGAAALKAGGPSYVRGIGLAASPHVTDRSPAGAILYVSGTWVGGIAFLAVVGAVVLTVIGGAPMKVLGWTLAAGAFLPAAAQVGSHTFAGLFEHVGYGAWFGSALAGYSVSALTYAVPPVKYRAARRLGVAAVAAAAIPGVLFAHAQFGAWPNSKPMIAALRPVVRGQNGPVLAEDANVVSYYFGGSLSWKDVSSVGYLAYIDPRTGLRMAQTPAAYSTAIRERYFGVVALLVGTGSDVHDPQLMHDITAYGGYRLVRSIPYQFGSGRGRFLVWAREQTGA